jgi:hypothetical protein
MLEETGVIVIPETVQVVTVVTTPDRRHNLIFSQSHPIEHLSAFIHDAEVSEVLVIYELVETAFPLHILRVWDFFEREA